MNLRNLSIVLALAMLCSALLYGCGSSSDNGQADETKSTISQVSENTEEDKMYEYKMYEYKIEELWCKRDSNNIFGQIYKPQGEDNQKFPTVIIGHGYTGTYVNNIRYAETFAKYGIAAYVFDFCGGSYSSKSDGKTTDMSILTEKEDMLAVFEQIKSLDFVDSENMFLMGESQGGVVASLCGSELSDKVRGLTLLYPAYSIPDMANDMYPDADSVPDEYSVWGMELGKIYYADCLTFDVYDEISKYKGPVKIYHGTEDQVVPFGYSVRAIEVYENAELKSENGAGHGFDEELQYSTAEDMTKFIKSNLA